MRKTLTMLALTLGIAGAAGADEPMRFNAQLNGGDLNGNPIATRATGQANLEVIDNGTAIRFRINVAGVNNLFMAHIHVSPNPGPIADDQPVGPIAFWFVPSTPGAPNSNVAQRVQGELSGGYSTCPGSCPARRPRL